MVLLSEDLVVSKSERRVLDVLVELPLCSVSDIAGVLGCQASTLYRPLSELQSAGLADSVMLGCTMKRTSRWFLTDDALRGLGRLGSSWHEEVGRCRILERLPAAEWFYHVVGTLEGLGKLESFEWFEGRCFDAAARFEYGWVTLWWCGMLQTEGVVYERLESLSMDLMSLPAMGSSPWPSMLCFVTNDRWEREVVSRVARRQVFSDMVSVWCVSDGLRSGASDYQPHRGWVYQPVLERETGGWLWEPRVEDSLWSGMGGVAVYRMWDAVVQWPGITASMCKQLLGDGSSSRTTERSLKVLLDDEMIERVRSVDGYRYFVSSKGIDRLARRDRVAFKDYSGRAMAQSWLNMPDRRGHEEGNLDLVGRFLENRLSVAAGWRCSEHGVTGRGIDPDAAVCLLQGPFGAGWHYIEYERSARGRYKVSRKLVGYASKSRVDNWPVLFVCWDDEAEMVFQDVGEDLGIRLLTTTIDRLAECGPVDNSECWSLFGRKVLVG